MNTDQIQGYELSPRQRDHVTAAADRAACRFLHVALRFDGEVTADGLTAALEDLVAEHEILRTRFEKVPGMALPLQVIEDAVAPPIEHMQCSLSDLATAFNQWRAQPVPPQETVAFSIVSLDGGGHALFLRLPFLVADRATVANIALYLCDHLNQNLPEEEPLQYVDLADWLSEMLTAPENAAAQNHWRRTAETPAEPKRLPWRRNTNGSGDFDPGRIAIALSEKSVAWLTGLTDANATLLAAWVLLLWRHGGSNQQRCQVAFDGRKFDELQDALGPLEQLLPIDVALEPHGTFSDLVTHCETLLTQARQTAESYHCSEVDAEATVFRYEPCRPLSSGQTTVSWLWDEGFAQPFGLQLTARETEGGLQLALDFDRTQFQQDDIVWLGGKLDVLLTTLAQCRDFPLSQLRRMTAEEAQTLPPLTETGKQNDDLFAAFTAQVAAQPEKIALLWNDQQLSYRELHKAVGRLAATLRDQHGVGPEKLVALCLERSPDMVVALLAVHQCGAAFLPLDPDHPPQRLAHVTAQIPVALCLTHRATRDRCRDMQLPVVDLNHCEAGSHQPVTRRRQPDNLAYAIATSGSSGTPKLVGNTFSGLANRIHWMQQHYQLDNEAVVLQKTPLSFDVSLWELFWPLCSGATLALAPHDGHRDPAVLAACIKQHQVSVLHFVPSMLTAFLQQEQGPQESLRLVVAGGEAVTPTMRDRFYETYPHARLEQSYGPTEASIAVCAHHVAAEKDETAIPIGRTITGTAAYVLGPDLHPVADGCVGELYLAGVCLARGYLGRGDLTAAAFVPNPFSDKGERLYRSGDLALRRADGNLVFIGRCDHQIKLRGYRMELGEVEQHLMTQPSVAAAVVDVVRREEGEYLTAWYVPNQPALPNLSQRLRDLLEQRLPHYMVPTHFVALEQLPLTANGKCDRRALPAPAVGKGAIEPPRNPREETLCEIWHTLLPDFDGHIHRNFFDCGGHSLLATRVIAQARDSFGVALSVRHMFEAPTVARLAALVEQLGGNEEPVLAPLTPAPADARLPLSFAQQRLWFLQACAPESSAYNIPAALRLHGRLDIPALSAALEQLVHRHRALRTRFIGDEHETQQIIDPPAPLVLFKEDLSGLDPAETETRCQALVEKNAGQPFDLSRDLPIRCLLIQRAADDHVLVVTLHHIVCDGWSSSLLIRELGEHYRWFVEKNPFQPPAPGLHYSDFAWWQRSEAGRAHLAAQRDYWRKQLADLGEPLVLPGDFSRPEVAAEKGRILRFTLPEDLASAARNLARRHDATLFMTLLATFKWWLYRKSGRRDLTVGTPSAGRNRAELEGMIGVFINTLVIRSQVSPQEEFGAWLARIKHTTLDAFNHQDVPFEQLVEDLKPQRRLDTTPLFQVMFVLQNTPEGNLALPNLSLEPMTVPRHAARFDLTLSISEQSDGVHASMEYRSDVWQADTVEGWWNEYRDLLQAIVNAPELPLTRQANPTGFTLVAAEGTNPPAQALAVRGFQLDRAALSAHLKQRCSAQDVVFQTTTNGYGDTQLAAYVVGAATDCDLNRVKNETNAALPLAARINNLVAVSQPPTDDEPPPLSRDYSAPATKMEQDLVAIWQDVLAVEPVGLNDDFWELGGTPDLARTLAVRLGDFFAATVLVDDVLARPTVAEQNAWLLTQLVTADEAALTALLDQLENEPEYLDNTLQTQDFPGNDRIYVEES